MTQYMHGESRNPYLVTLFKQHSVNGIERYPDLLLGSPILHSPVACRYSIERLIVRVQLSKSISDHFKPASSPVLSPVCSKNLYWYSYVFPTIPFTNLFCCSSVSASFFCVGFPISDFTIPLQGFFIITSF